jgi:short-subunit dehydrogenase
MKKLDLKARYNAGDSYVLITGCTAGIGEEMAHQFAKEGFNIVLLSRSMEKLKKVEQDIKTKTNANIKTRIV